MTNSIKPSVRAFLNQVRELAAADRLEEAIRLLRQLLQDSPLLDEALQQSGRLSRLQQQIRNGTASIQDATLTRNQIREGILGLLTEVETQAGPGNAAIQEEVERAVVSIVNSKNVAVNSSFEAEAIHIGDKTEIHHHYGDKKIPSILTAATASVPASFLGREQELSDIRRLLSGSNTLALVNSEGGMGKTTLAAAYWNQSAGQYKHRAWLFCEAGILAAMRSQLPGPLGFQEQMNEAAGDTAEQACLLKNRMAALDKDCLLVLDNANSPEDIRAFLDAMIGLGWHVLMTSRCSRVLPHSANEYPIKSLPPALARQLFERNYREETPGFDDLLNRFLKAVGYNTLCIEIFSKNLREGGSWGYTFAEFLKQLEQSGLFLGDNSFDIATDYAHHMRKSVQSSDDILRALYNLAELEPEETELLIRFSLLPAENHAPNILMALLPHADKRTLKRQLDRLAQKGWLAADTQSYRVSPVVQKIVLRQHADRRWPLAEPMIEKLHTIFETQGLHSVNIATAGPFAALVFGIVENIDAANKDIAILFNRLWVYYTATGNLAQAMETATRMQDVCEKYGDKNLLAISYSQLGSTHTGLGNLPQALTFFEQYNQLEKELHESYPQNVSFKNSLAISYSKLGFTHTALGNLPQALTFFEERSRLGKELHESYPQNVSFKSGLAISYSQLGSTHTELGNLPQALTFFEQFARLMKELHESYPQNVNFKNLLAISYQFLGITHTALGNLPQALTFFEKYLELSKELHESYPQNVDFKNSLAISYEKLGETHKALGNLPQALTFFEERSRLGKELYESYPQNVDFKNGLATSYLFLGAFFRDQMNDPEKSKEYIQKGYELYAELVRDFPEYASFKQNYEWAKSALGY